MSGAKILEGAKQAALWTKATKGGIELPTEADRKFLDLLDEREPYIILGEHGLGVFHRCERLGWATLIGGHKWILTEAGRIVLETRVHQPATSQPGQNGESGG